MHRRTIAALVAAVGLLLVPTACGSGSSTSNVKSNSRPKIDHSNYVRTVDNPWYPLKPGTTYRYRGMKDGKASIDLFSVTDRTKMIMGVPATVVRDRLLIGGKLAEDTVDWYAQDKQGNVWYLGESTRELDSKGRVKSTEGTWEAGIDGAKAGIFMPAHPSVGRSFRQEYYKGHAEDHFKIISLASSVMVPYVSSRRALKTQEWTPLEPGVVDTKYYVRGIGTVYEATIKGGQERSELVAVKTR